MTDTFLPESLTPEACRTLEEPELAVAVALHIFKDDLTANTEERVRAAVNNWLRTDPKWHFVGVGPDERVCQEQSRGIVLRCWAVPPRKSPWEFREGQPFQADLEAHVAAYQAEPPELTDSLAVSMFDLGMPLNGFVAVSRPGSSDMTVGRFRTAWDGELAFGEITDGPTFRIAVFRAALVQAVSGAWEPEKGTE